MAGAGAEADSASKQHILHEVVPVYCSAYVFAGHPAPEWGSLQPRTRAGLEQHLDLAWHRNEHETLTRVVPDDAGVRGYLVCDDQPGVVEAVVGALASVGETVDDLNHPTVAVQRTSNGDIVAVGPATENAPAELWISVNVPGATDIALLERVLRGAVSATVAINTDAAATVAVLESVASDIADAHPAHAELLRWLAADNLRPFGYQKIGDPSSRLGIWRHAPELAEAALAQLNPADGEGTVSFETIYLDEAWLRTAYPQVVRSGDHVFVGVYSLAALHDNLLEIPVLRDKAAEVRERALVDPESYSGQALLELLQTFPRVEAFSYPTDELTTVIGEVLVAATTGMLRAFVRVDPNGTVISALIYVAQDRYSTRLRQEFENILLTELQGEDIEFNGRVGLSSLAVVHLTLRVTTPLDPAALAFGSPRQQRLQEALAGATRNWVEQVAAADADADRGLLRSYAGALPDAYKQARSDSRVVGDLTQIEALGGNDFAVALDPGARADIFTVSMYVTGAPATLSDLLPMLHSLGVSAIEEHPYDFVRPDGVSAHVYEFEVRVREGLEVVDAETIQQRWSQALDALWHNRADVDEFNTLVLTAGLTWRQAAMLRTYSRYLQQCEFPYSTAHIAQVLGNHVEISRALARLFEVSFDPAHPGDRDSDRAEVVQRLDELIGQIISLDSDRVLRTLATAVTATLRTNFYRGDREILAVKLAPRDIPAVPAPRPEFEIFVHSPQVEGVHLRFGTVARGGLRWSDRLADFRTEILGLVKAQAVKNAVIVPVGAKGGFVVRRPSLPTGDAARDRETVRAEGISCYRSFISGLLDVTDNVNAAGEVVPPEQVVSRDGADTYLVVAADKGTASFSDIANGVAQEYQFWLGDAFASGGSAGYDHKKMGITARGAWESVKRHFIERGVDTQTQDFTVVGVGDMSGDVFGNGMLLSPHIRLIAAFDHRDIFIDPNPVAQQSIAERRRLFELPRSSWQDYDPALISTGGGVWSRELKSIPVSKEVIAALGLPDDTTHLSPPELITAILLAPVDLFWNGGIGTYIKASTESNDEVGDKANDGIRVNGDQVRAKVIGEGGNLGVTELGRVEYARSGGRINTDALDNSAGVDCSDHEVNIKILLDAKVADGTLPREERNPLLESMTDEVATLVLADNIAQNAELGFARSTFGPPAGVYGRLLTDLATAQGVDLKLEALPTEAQLARRAEPLTSPELATTMAHVKLALKGELLGNEFADSEVLIGELLAYFPVPLRERYAAGVRGHRLRREIVATSVVNEMVSLAGMTHDFRLREGSGGSAVDVIRAYVVASRVFDFPELWASVQGTTKGQITVVDSATAHIRRLLFRASRWLLANRPQPLAVGAEVTRYRERVRELTADLPDLLGATSRRRFDEHTHELLRAGMELETADECALSLYRFSLLDVIDVADITDRAPREVAELYFAILEYVEGDQLLTAISDLDRGDRWHALARLALRDDLFSSLRQATLSILGQTEPEETAAEKLREWEFTSASRLGRMRETFAEIADAGTWDLATISVAVRQLRSAIG